METDISSGALTIDPEQQLKIPKMFNVIMHNDDFTPVDFVVEILKIIFKKDQQTAEKIMLDVHNKGSGICGCYPYEIAETKAAIANEQAKNHATRKKKIKIKT